MSIPSELGSLPRSQQVISLEKIRDYHELTRPEKNKHITEVVSRIIKAAPKGDYKPMKFIREYAVKTGYTVPNSTIRYRIKNMQKKGLIPASDLQSIPKKRKTEVEEISLSRPVSPQIERVLSNSPKLDYTLFEEIQSLSPGFIQEPDGAAMEARPQSTQSQGLKPGFIPLGMKGNPRPVGRPPKRNAVQSDSSSSNSQKPAASSGTAVADSAEVSGLSPYLIPLAVRKINNAAGQSNDPIAADIRDEAWLKKKAEYEAYCRENDIGLYFFSQD